MSTEWKVNDRVQYIDYEDEKRPIYTGSITELRMDKQTVPSYNRGFYSRTEVEEEYLAAVKVKWDDDGTEEELEVWEVEHEDNEYEREFRLAVPDAQTRINEKLELASKYLQEAVNISEETGVAFNAHISFLSQSYVPTSFQQKHPDVSRDIMKSICNVYYRYEGWEHSAVC